ncbi:hypothetical protein [Mangrovihabitans endophyticus]|uniref:Excreted virulence factor EspC, type VII ESX diderm n=1 Tax=Mangrovihabitans endophyticus TaxID=1751298 RepID=A0A8J3FT78_9ACTN|nr:hypothetical protein [Mangrovihabitans endophyticus]GGL21407.1 hypothetical protein GCM10012284_65030 [Mangrovihabitans endophyticus]
MSIQVETPYLRAYAARIDANCDTALADMARYAHTHCRNVDGLDGALTPARPVLESLADDTRDLIAAAQNGLRRTADDLRRCATDYDHADGTAAETLWSLTPAWTTPDTWHELDRTVPATASTGEAGAELTLMPPPYTPDAAEAENNLKSLFGTVNTVIEKLTGYDLLGAALPLLLGDWGALKRIARAYGELETGWSLVAADLNDGMDALSPHWNSTTGGTGGASQAFDYHLRHRWTAAQTADTMQQMCESMAAEYEHTIKGMLYILNLWLSRLQKGIGKIMVAASWAKLAAALYSVVSSVYDLICDGVALAVEQVQMFIEGSQMIAAATVTMRHRMNGDFDALATD